MPKFLLPPAALRLPTISLDEAAKADRCRLHNSQQWCQQPTPNPSPSPETLSRSLPEINAKVEPKYFPFSKTTVTPSSSASGFAVHSPSKRNHTARRAAGSATRPPRPRNAFILYRSNVIANGRINTNQQNEASAIAGRMWKMEDDATKEHYQALAAEEKARHALMYPDYKYSPGTKKASTASPTVKTSPSLINDRQSTKRPRAEDDDEAEWSESVSARARHTVRQTKKSRLSTTIPTPESSASPEPEAGGDIDDSDHLTLQIDMDVFDIPEFDAEGPITEDVDATISDNTMFANFFVSHQKLLDTHPDVTKALDSHPTFSLSPTTSCQPQAAFPPTHRIPCLDTASFAAYKPSTGFEDRFSMPIKPMHTYPRRLSEVTAQAQDVSLSLHVSDDMLFKDFVIADALQSVDAFETAIRPICPLWMMDTKDLAQELSELPLF